MLELSFRYYLFPWYKTEFTWENSPPQPHGGLMIIGDSYTALHQSFAFRIRDSLDIPVHICGVPGTSIKEALTFLPVQLAEHRPSELWYQVYMGNDFLDICHPLNWNSLPLSRNLYWLLSDRFISLKYLNYKLGGLGHQEQGPDIKSINVFSPQQYNPHEKLYFSADPEWLLQLNHNEGLMWNNVQTWEASILQMQKHCIKEGIVFKVLLIPHPAQVGALVLEDVLALGGASGEYTAMNPLQNSIHGFLSGHQVPFIDVSDTLSNAVRTDSLPVYFPSDPHLTAYGNEIVTKTLLSWYNQ